MNTYFKLPFNFISFYFVKVYASIFITFLLFFFFLIIYESELPLRNDYPCCFKFELKKLMGLVPIYIYIYIHARRLLSHRLYN